jgi:iron complex outermembrane receptor protein
MSTVKYHLSGLALALGILAPAAASGLDRAALAGRPDVTFATRTIVDGTVQGRVVNMATREPVGGARVQVQGTDRITMSDGDGGYVLTGVPDGRQRLVVTRAGFEPQMVEVMVSSGATVSADFAVVPRAVELNVVATVGTVIANSTEQAVATLALTPGAVSVVPATAFQQGPASTIRDVLVAVPGVVTQTRWGPDARVSIRGSGLSRHYGNRGLNAFMDGIPINTADGLFDLFEMDPTAYRHVEVYKGANALRYGSNSLGGAINFVTPTGRDAARLDARVDVGSFGQVRAQASTGAASGRVDYFVTGSSEQSTGYREHSKGNMQRASGNVGFRVSAIADTRFYVNANAWDGRLPGEVSKASAMSDPKAANPVWIAQDQQRNINSIRVANRTTLRLGAPTSLEFGAFGVHRHVDHPIFQYIDYTVGDFGGFARLTNESSLGGHRNRLVAGANVHNGKNDENRWANTGNATKGALASSVIDRSRNYSAYFENAFYLQSKVSLVAGTQFLHATRDRTDRFLSNGNQSGRITFDLWTPKLGLLWDVKPTWQVFTNVSRSAEVPTFDVNTFTNAANSNLAAQTATTYEVGTRGRGADVTWDIALYRAMLRNELQCLTNSTALGTCNISNADRTIHQGVEAGVGLALVKSAFATGDRLWLNATYTYNDFRFDGDARFDDNQLPGVPAHIARIEALYNGPRGFFVGPNVDWVPQKFYADNTNTLSIDPYTLLNLRAGIDLAARWSAYVEARNLLDETYISTAAIVERANPTDARFNPGYGRSIFSGIRVSW